MLRRDFLANQFLGKEITTNLQFTLQSVGISETIPPKS